MRVNRVFVDLSLATGTPIELCGETAHYIGTVLRLRDGATLHLFDGSGGCWLARVQASAHGAVTVEPIEFLPEERESRLSVTLAQGVARGQHMDYTVQKAVELGVQRIVPLLTEHGNVRLNEARSAHRMQHWRKIIVGACEQCGRNRIPELLPPVSFREWLARDESPLRLALHPRGDCALNGLTGARAGVTILSGPEGGLAEAEYEAALRSAYVGIRLGPRVLRTDTAALAALAACQSLWGDLR